MATEGNWSGNDCMNAIGQWTMRASMRYKCDDKHGLGNVINEINNGEYFLIRVSKESIWPPLFFLSNGDEVAEMMAEAWN